MKKFRIKSSDLMCIPYSLPKRVLITGGAGYVGSQTNKTLNRAGYETVVFDNLVYGHRKHVKWGEFILGDLSDREQIKQCFMKYSIRAVMHFGSFANVGESVADPGKYYRNNVVNSLNLLDVMCEADVKYIIFSSTCSTYGVPVSLPISEKHAQKPVNPYGRSKMMIEEILKDYDQAYGIKHINLRYFNATGADPEGEIGEAHDPETHLIPLAIYAALGKNDDVKLFGTDYPTKDGTCIRDYIHVADLADAHIKALEYLEATGKSDSFNLGNGSGYSVREVLDTVKKISGREFKVIEERRRDGDPPVLVGNSQKARKILHWEPAYTDLEGIVETAWRWHRKNHAE